MKIPKDAANGIMDCLHVRIANAVDATEGDHVDLRALIHTIGFQLMDIIHTSAGEDIHAVRLCEILAEVMAEGLGDGIPELVEPPLPEIQVVPEGEVIH